VEGRLDARLRKAQSDDHATEAQGNYDMAFVNHPTLQQLRDEQDGLMEALWFAQDNSIVCEDLCLGTSEHRRQNRQKAEDAAEALLKSIEEMPISMFPEPKDFRKKTARFKALAESILSNRIRQPCSPGMAHWLTWTEKDSKEASALSGEAITSLITREKALTRKEKADKIDSWHKHPFLRWHSWKYHIEVIGRAWTRRSRLRVVLSKSVVDLNMSAHQHPVAESHCHINMGITPDQFSERIAFLVDKGAFPMHANIPPDAEETLAILDKALLIMQEEGALVKYSPPEHPKGWE